MTKPVQQQLVHQAGSTVSTVDGSDGSDEGSNSSSCRIGERAVVVDVVGVTPTTKTTPFSSSSGSSSSPITLTLTLTYLLIWCLHLWQPVLETWLFGPGHGGLDCRPLVDWDYALLVWVTGTAVLVVKVMMLAPGTEEASHSRQGRIWEGSTTKTTTTTTTAVVMNFAVLAHIWDIQIRLSRMPAVWDHEYWATWINVSFVATFFCCCVGWWSRDVVSSSLSRWKAAQDAFVSVARVQLGILYLAATFWKLNTSFMDPATSCGTVLILELLGSYLLGPLNVSSGLVVRSLAHAAPAMTLVVEAILGVGFLYAGLATPSTTRKVRHLTLIKGTAFHIMIYMMPVNAAGGFSLDCMTRLVLLLESSEIEALVSSWSSSSSAGRRRRPWAILARTAAVTVALSWVRHVATDGASPLWDVGFTCSVLLGAFYCQVVFATTSTTTVTSTSSAWQEGPRSGGKDGDGNATNQKGLAATAAAAEATVAASPPPPPSVASPPGAATATGGDSVPPNGDNASFRPSPSQPSPALRLTVTSCVLLGGTFLHAFVFTVLGVQQMGAPTMYANLRSYRGGNHYLVPTAVLGDTLLYGGGLLLVAESNSTAVNLLLGYTKSRDVFPRNVVTYLEAAVRQSPPEEEGEAACVVDAPLMNNDGAATAAAVTEITSTSTSTLPLGHMPLQFFPMCMFNPSSRDVMMDVYQESNSPGSPLFAPFIMPLSTIRSALQRATADGEKFVVKLVYPAYDINDDTNEKRKRVIVLDNTGACEVHYDDGGGHNSNNSSDDGRDNNPPTTPPIKQCADDDVARLLLIPKSHQGLWQRFLDKILTPYPELAGFDEEICMA